MNLHPFDQVVANARVRMSQGWTIYQQFNCSGCGTKQTMSEPNHFWTEGHCEECGHITNIKADGCNFMAALEATAPTILDLLKEKEKKEK